MSIDSTVALAVGISSLVTWGGTKLWDAWRMEKKYRTKEDSEKCMEAREKAELKITEQLEKQKKRLILGNLIMARLCKELKIPDSEIKAFEKALGVKINDAT